MDIVNLFSWGQLLITVGELLLFFGLLYFLRGLLERAYLLGNFQNRALRLVHEILLIGKPLAILLVLMVFVFINVPFHGALVLTAFIFAFNHIKNYISGQVIKFDPYFALGKQIKTANFQGIISAIGNFGLKTTTSKGIQFIDYSTLTQQGYLLQSGEEISGYYQLKISRENTLKDNFQKRLMDLLVMTPFLDWNHKPEISFIDEHQLNVKVLVKEETHLYDFINWLKGFDYDCKIVNK